MTPPSDVARFEAFVREYQHLVFGTAVRLLGATAEAEDVSQTVFLKAFERFDEIGGSPSTPGWLKTVTTHLCLNHLARYRARWQFFSELEGDEGGASFADTIAAPSASQDEPSLLNDARVAQLERALRALPDHQRVPLVLFHFEERSYQDIATLLGISIGKVKTDIHRGRLALKKVLDGMV
jgi:RNA polymerase sigma-70 factor (ECF subfamily)